MSREREAPVTVSTVIPAIAGFIAGAVAFLPFPLTLAPVVSGKQNADMLKGVVGLAVSIFALIFFSLIVYAVFGAVFRMFFFGEAAGFVGCMLAFSVIVVRYLGNSK